MVNVAVTNVARTGRETSNSVRLSDRRSPVAYVAHSNEVVCSISSIVVRPSNTFLRPS